MCAVMSGGKTGREAIIHLEVEDLFCEAQDAIQDNLPTHPSEEQLDGVTPDYGLVAWALYRRERAAKADRDRKKQRRKRKRATPQMVERKCQQCGSLFSIVLNRRGTPKQYCSDACKMKAYRIRSHTIQNAPVATDAESSLCVTDCCPTNK